MLTDSRSKGSGNEPSDLEELRVTLAKSGDASVWESWFDEYYPKLYRYAYFRLRRRVDAEDLVAQVFLEAVRGIDRYRYQGRPILAWLYRIAHNLIADRFKQESRLNQTGSAEVPDEEVEPGPEDLIDNLDLLRALDFLTEEQREVIYLRFFAAMSAKEVAGLLDKTETAVFSLQARALMTLKERLGDLPNV